MIDLFLESVLRQDTAAVTQLVSAARVRDILRDRDTQHHRGVFHETGIPLRWMVAHDAAITAAGSQYPLVGGVLPDQAGMGSTQIKLHADAKPLPGMLVVQMDGAGVGEWSVVDSVGGANTLGLTQAWVNQPATGADVELLLPCWLAAWVYVKAEFDVAGQSIRVRPLFLDCGLAMDGATPRAPVPAVGPAHTIQANGSTWRALASHEHGDAQVFGCMGGVGWKIEVVAAPPGGARLWGAYT